MTEGDFLAQGHADSWRSFFRVTELKWDELKKSTSALEDLVAQYNYQGKLTAQRPADNLKVLYNTSGTHISSCVVDTYGSPPSVYDYPTQGFIVDTTAYYYETDDGDEAHYLCALLNAPCVDEAIKILPDARHLQGRAATSRAPPLKRAPSRRSTGPTRTSRARPAQP